MMRTIFMAACAGLTVITMSTYSWGENLVVARTGLSFGDFASSGSAGSVIVTPAGVRSAQGGVALIQRGTVTAAEFLLTGKKNSPYAIILPADNTTYLSSGGRTMALSGFTCSVPLSGRLPLSGQLTFRVGARATTTALQTPGSYSGSVSVIVQ